MKPIALSEIKNILEYEQERPGYLQRIIALKRHRRVHLGDRLTLVFENRDTVVFQIQEMVRVERIVETSRIQDEIDIYNGLLPGRGELSATLFIEIEEQDRIKEELLKLLGVDEALRLRIGETHSIPGCFEPGRSQEDKISAVQYVRFELTPGQCRAFCQGEEAIYLQVDHPNYQARTQLPEGVRRSLAEDLAADLA